MAKGNLDKYKKALKGIKKPKVSPPGDVKMGKPNRNPPPMPKPKKGKGQRSTGTGRA